MYSNSAIKNRIVRCREAGRLQSRFFFVRTVNARPKFLNVQLACDAHGACDECTADHRKNLVGVRNRAFVNTVDAI